MQMTACPICKTPMKKEKIELQKGIFALVEVCPRCEDEWIDEKGYEALYKLFTRKTFKIGESLAIRILPYLFLLRLSQRPNRLKDFFFSFFLSLIMVV